MMHFPAFRDIIRLRSFLIYLHVLIRPDGILRDALDKELIVHQSNNTTTAKPRIDAVLDL